LLSKRSVWELALNPSDQLVCNLYTSGVIYIGRTTAALTSLENTWVHLAVTYSGGETNASVKLYVNGAQADTADSSAGSYTGMPSSSVTVTLGSLDTSLRWLGGYIERCTVYNKELSLAEIKEELNTRDINWYSFKSNILSSWGAEAYTGANISDRKGGITATGVNTDSTNLIVGNSYPRRYQAVQDRESAFVKFGGFAWNMDGATEYISLGNVLNPTTNSFSWVIWFNNSTNKATNSGLLQKSDGTLQFGLVIDSNEKVVAQIRQDGANYRLLFSTRTYVDGCWHFAMFTFDNSTDTLKL